MLFVESRVVLMERFQEQADRPPVAASNADYDAADESVILTFDQLRSLIVEYCNKFVYLSRRGQDIDIAVWATELLQYFNGPVPEIEILPQRDKEPSLFRVTIDPKDTAE